MWVQIPRDYSAFPIKYSLCRMKPTVCNSTKHQHTMHKHTCNNNDDDDDEITVRPHCIQKYQKLITYV